jgi:4-amino-4-deoxy-L-arabinose transferase-like glycosyltransferase
VLSAVLWRRNLPFASFFVAGLCTLTLQLRDVADWIVTEPLAIGFAALFGSALVVLAKRPSLGLSALGASCALILLIRPNLGFAFFPIAVALLARSGRDRWSSIATVLLGFAGAILLLVLLACLTRLPLDPRSISASQALFFGAQEYAWPPDPGEWTPGQTPKERQRGDLEAVRNRWVDFFRRFGPDELRSLIWRSTHPMLSAEQFPSRWKEPHYLRTSKLLRRWWWIPAILVTAAAIACAVAARSEWRFVPAVIVAISSAQGLLFGAETRYTLPFLPLLFLGVGVAIPSLRESRRGWIMGACAAALLGVIVYKIPDTVASDYAVVAPGDIVRQHVPRSHFRGLEAAVIHVRMLAAPRNVGLEIRGDQRLLLRRSPGDPSPYAAFWTLSLPPAAYDRARREGVDLEVRCLGDPSGKGVLYFPVVPEVLDSRATLNGSVSLPSPFGGRTSGAFPVWTHARGRVVSWR